MLDDCDIQVNIKGLDIGTGCYGIYAILGNKKYGWEMKGTDIDKESIDSAKEIILKNKIENVSLMDIDPDKFFPQESFTFSMCNPPFFQSKEEMLENASFKQKLNHEGVIASENELITQGGEVEFVNKMIEMSKNHKDSIIWFSSLLGKKSSLDPLIDVLVDFQVDSYFIRDYQLGNTKRWILFWSFQFKRPKIENDYTRVVPTIVHYNLDLDKVEKVLQKLPLEYQVLNDEIVITTQGDVWSRSFRRKRQKLEPQPTSVFKITSSYIYWHFGPSAKVFQSFHTYIKKTVN